MEELPQAFSDQQGGGEGIDAEHDHRSIAFPSNPNLGVGRTGGSGCQKTLPKPT